MKITGNEPAMPIEYEDYNSVGLTKREYYAAMAMQGFITQGIPFGDEITKRAVILADDLINELNKE